MSIFSKSDHLTGRVWFSEHYRGMSYEAISEHLLDMYDVEISKATISTVTDKLIPFLQNGVLGLWENICPLIF